MSCNCVGFRESINSLNETAEKEAYNVEIAIAKMLVHATKDDFRPSSIIELVKAYDMARETRISYNRNYCCKE